MRPLKLDRANESADHIQSSKLSRRQRGLLAVSLFATYINVGISLGHDTFTGVGVVAWGISVGAFVAAFWGKRPRIRLSGCRFTSHGIRITWFGALFLTLVLLGIFFRAWHLRQIPPEMTWDHTQKLLDVRDIVEGGLRPIFFYRNTGREPFQFYWTALLIRLTQHPIDFTILKVGTVLAGLLTLPGIYLLAREMYGRTVGLWAMGFAAVASWPVILSRSGLRYPFAPLFSAWSFYYMVRGLRRGERESFLLLGLCLGVGLYGYTAFRLIPVAVAYTWIALRIVAKPGEIHANLSWRNFGLVVVTAFLVFIPLGIFSVTHKGAFWERSAWYLNNKTSFGPLVFLDNVKNVLLMFNWRGDSMPLTNFPYEPVLDPILGGLLVLGVFTAIKRVMGKADDFTFTLILLGVFSLFPSALAINFPHENPSVVRTGCAIPVVCTLAALPIGTWLENFLFINRQTKKVKTTMCAALAGLMCLLIGLNANRVLVRYPQTYRTLAFNSSEVANAIRCFDALMGNSSDVYIITGPGWLNDNAVAFELGLPVWKNTLAEATEANPNTTASTMYILLSGNTADLHTLQELFPTGLEQIYPSRYNRDFTVYIVPGKNAARTSVVQQTARLTSCSTQ